MLLWYYYKRLSLPGRRPILQLKDLVVDTCQRNSQEIGKFIELVNVDVTFDPRFGFLGVSYSPSDFMLLKDNIGDDVSRSFSERCEFRRNCVKIISDFFTYFLIGALREEGPRTPLYCVLSVF